MSIAGRRRRNSVEVPLRTQVEAVREISEKLSEEPLEVFPVFGSMDGVLSNSFWTSAERQSSRCTQRSRTFTGGASDTSISRSLSLSPRTRSMTYSAPPSNAEAAGLQKSQPCASRRFSRSSSCGAAHHPAVEEARRQSEDAAIDAGEGWPTSIGSIRACPRSPSMLSHQKTRKSLAPSSPTCPPRRSKNEIMSNVIDAHEIRSWTELVAHVVQEEENTATAVAPWAVPSSPSFSESRSPISEKRRSFMGPETPERAVEVRRAVGFFADDRSSIDGLDKGERPLDLLRRAALPDL